MIDVWLFFEIILIHILQGGKAVKGLQDGLYFVLFLLIVLFFVLVFCEYFLEEGFSTVQYLELMVFNFFAYFDFAIPLFFWDLSFGAELVNLIYLAFPFEHELHFKILKFLLDQLKLFLALPLALKFLSRWLDQLAAEGLGLV